MIRELGVDQVRFATLAGTSKSVVNQWITERIHNISAKYAFSLELKTGYRAAWIMFGDLPKKISDCVNGVKEPLGPYNILSKDAIELAQNFDAADPDIKAAMITLINRLSPTHSRMQNTEKKTLPAPDTSDQSGTTEPLPETVSPIDPTVRVRGHTFHHSTTPKRRKSDPHA